MTEAANAEEQHYRGATRRIYFHIAWLGIAGAIAAFTEGGAAVGVGFLLGAAVSAINFRWLHRLVDAVGPEPRKKSGKALGIFLSFRYVLFGLAGYVIVKYFKVNVMAALVGLFVAVAAVIVEILYELIYVRT